MHPMVFHDSGCEWISVWVCGGERKEEAGFLSLKGVSISAREIFSTHKPLL